MAGRRPRDGRPWRSRVRAWHALGVIPCWLVWVTLVGLVNLHDCVENVSDYLPRLDRVVNGVFQSYDSHRCVEVIPSWRHPFRFTIAGEDTLFFWLFGAWGAIATAAVILYLARRLRWWHALSVSPFLAVWLVSYERAERFPDDYYRRYNPVSVTGVTVQFLVMTLFSLLVALFVVYLARRQSRILRAEAVERDAPAGTAG